MPESFFLIVLPFFSFLYQFIQLLIWFCYFRVIDVAGQKNQRKKWIHFFEGVAAVIFCASLSGYAEMLEEDPTLVRLKLR